MLRMGIVGAENSHCRQIAKLCNLDKKVACRVTMVWGETPKYAKIAAEATDIPTIVGDWREMLRLGFAECFRVLRPEGTLIFQWSESDYPVREILALTPERPLYGHRSGKFSKTHWIAFLKPNIGVSVRMI